MNTHSNATFSNNLTEGENQFLQHVMRWGSSGYPVFKVGRKWSFEKIAGAGGSPVLYRTKREAEERVQAYIEILLDRVAGRLEPSVGSPAAALPEGWTEGALGGLATNRDQINGGIVDRAIVSGEWFVVSHHPAIGVLEGFKDRAAAFQGLAAALAKV